MLPSLKFAKQPYPHTQIGICVNKVPLDRNNLKRFAQHHGFIVTEIDKSVILSEQPVKNAGGGV